MINFLLRIRYSAICSVVAVAVSFVGFSTARAGAIVSQQQLVTATRIAQNTWQFKYQVTVQNALPALNAVTVTAADSSPNGSVQQNSVSLGNLLANSTVSATVTFQVTGNQPGANGDYHDSFWRDYLSHLVIEVIPGPGPVAQATISSDTGGTIVVTGAGNPLNGTQVVVPPGALGDPIDTITIGYSKNPPAALDSTARAAGVAPVSAFVTLDRTGTTSFVQDLLVTVPFDTSALNPNDFPAILYWNTDLQHYEAVQVIGINRSAGTATFVTKHFSGFVAVGLRGLSNTLLGLTPFHSLLPPYDTQFKPAIDGFEVENFSTQYNDSSDGGNCYGMAAYAAWYFAAKPSAIGLYAIYQTPGLTGNPHIPQQDGVARELIHQAFVKTGPENDTTTSHEMDSFLLPDYALLAVTNLMLDLELTHAPQMLGVYQTNYPMGQLEVGGHSVLVYAWGFDSSGPPGSLKFSVYDPNVPDTDGYPITWTPGSGFAPFMSEGDVYPYIAFDAVSSHFDAPTLNGLFALAGRGWTASSSSFNRLSVAMPRPVDAFSYPSTGTYSISASGPTNFFIDWNCTPSKVPGAENCGPSHAHVFLDSVPQGAIPIDVSPGSEFFFTVPRLTTPSAELMVIVSKDDVNSKDQEDISTGYAAYIRAELITGPQTVGTYVANFTMTGTEGGIPGGSNCVWADTFVTSLTIVLSSGGAQAKMTAVVTSTPIFSPPGVPCQPGTAPLNGVPLAPISLTGNALSGSVSLYYFSEVITAVVSGSEISGSMSPESNQQGPYFYNISGNFTAELQ